MKKKKIIERKIVKYISKYKDEISFNIVILENTYQKPFKFPLEKLNDFIVLLENIINNQNIQEENFTVRSVTKDDLELLKLNNINIDCLFKKEKLDEHCDVAYLIFYKNECFYICKKHLKLLYKSLSQSVALYKAEEIVKETVYVEE